MSHKYKGLQVLEFKGTPPTEPAPHGNAKQDKPYRKMSSQTRQLVANLSRSETGKTVYGEVLEREGEESSLRNPAQVHYERSKALAAGDADYVVGGPGLPRFGTQWEDLKNWVGSGKLNSERFRCKTIEGNTPEGPLVVLRDLTHLSFLNEMIANSNVVPLLKVDATYNLGSVYVTSVSVQWPCVENENRSQSDLPEHPISLCAVMLHNTLSTDAYGALIDEMARGFPNDRYPRMLVDPVQIHSEKGWGPEYAWGMDQEKALVKAIKDRLPDAEIMHCLIHLYRNFNKRAAIYGIGAESKKYMWHCILDAIDETDDEQFDRCVQHFVYRTETLRMAKNKQQQFVRYGTKLLETINQHARLPRMRARREGGQDGDIHLLPKKFTNNNAESVNSMLKRRCGNQPQSLVYILERCIHIMTTQEQDVRKAMRGEGSYRLCAGVRQHRTTMSAWRQLEPEEKKRRILAMFADANAADLEPSRTKRPRHPVPSHSRSGRTTVLAREGLKRKPGQSGRTTAERARPGPGRRSR